MRILGAAALAVLAVGITTSGPAHATWSCTGPEVACNSAGTSVKAKRAAKKAAYRSQKSAHRSQKAARVAAQRPGKRKPATTASHSYSGGGSHGMASYYWQGQQTASGARFNPSAMTAAHRSLPFGTRVRVTNKRNGRSVVVTINDRGPFIKGRIIDLSRGAAGIIGMTGAGVAPVAVEVLGRG